MTKIKALGGSTTHSPATDNSLLFQYARLLSPGIVTSDDFENAKRSGGEGYGDTIRSFFLQMQNGLLPDNVRTNIVHAAATQFKGESDIFKLRKKDYTDLATKNNLNPDEVTGLRKVRTDVSGILSGGATPNKIGRFTVVSD